MSDFSVSVNDTFDYLVTEYNEKKRKVEELSKFFNDPDYEYALDLFKRYNKSNDRKSLPYSDTTGALKVLDADYWSTALSRTDVYDWMPAKRREEWNTQIRDLDIPTFEEDTVRTTILDLLHSRKQFFAESVDGMFRSLSRTHVTNQPEGFSKRMILPNIISNWGDVLWEAVDLIYDFRCAISSVLKRERPSRNSTEEMLNWVKRSNGVWQTVDGGAFKIRIYNGAGTAHIEVSPHVSWRLNEVLATIHPMAIPEKNRQPAAKKTKLKTFDLMQDMLPEQVLHRIGNIREHVKHVTDYSKFGSVSREVVPNVYYVNYSTDKHVNDRIDEVLRHIGGVKQPNAQSLWVFDYNPISVCERIQFDGSIPDFKSHQFYPTPIEIIHEAVMALELESEHSVLEPSAGIGDIVIRLNGNVTAVEISSLHSDIIKERTDATVITKDFMKWKCNERFDRIIMNPPYSQGRWKAHTMRAIEFLKEDGVLVAILPKTAVTGLQVDGWCVEVVGEFEDKFDKANVDVVVLKVTKTTGE